MLIIAIGITVGENPTYVKFSQQRRTKFHIYGGNELCEAERRDVVGCNVSEGYKLRNMRYRRG